MQAPLRQGSVCWPALRAGVEECGLPSEQGGLEVDAATIELLEGWVKSAPQARLKRRSRIILLLAGGLSQAAVAAQLGVSRRTVAIWRQRFLEGGATTLQHDRPGRGRPKGRSACRLSHDSPPKKFNEMERASIPNRLATRQCASSWTITDPKNSALATAPARIVAVRPQAAWA